VTRHRVRLIPQERILEARADQSVLDAALASGLNLPHSCKSGHCGSCRARLLAGRIDYPHGAPLGLSAEEARDGLVLLCQARAASDLVVEARPVQSATESLIKSLPCRVARMQRLAPDVQQVFLRLPSVERLEFAPGQYLDVLLEEGQRRSFSIASPPHDSELLELHVRHVRGGRFTGRLFGAQGAGTLLRIEGPLGQFIYREQDSPALLIAGGTGFAPLKAMLRHALERGSSRSLELYWGARTAADLYEDERLLEWTRQYPRLRYQAVLSHASQVTRAHHRLGWVHQAVLADHPRLESYDVYAAGPPGLITAVRGSFPAHGLPAEQLSFDSFDYAPDER